MGLVLRIRAAWHTLVMRVSSDLSPLNLEFVESPPTPKNTMMKQRATLVTLILAAASSLPAYGAQQQVDALGINKRNVYLQTAPNVTSPWAYLMSSFLEGSGLTQQFPSPNNRVVTPSGGVYPLAFDIGRWYFDQEFATAAQRDLAFPDGIYNFRVGATSSVTLAMPSSAFPNVPQLSFPIGTWSGGQLTIDALQAWNGLSFNVTTISNGNGFVTVDAESACDYWNTILAPSGGTSVSGQVPPQLLTSGEINSIELEFDDVVDAVSLVSYPWNSGTGFSLRSTRTIVEVQVLPNYCTASTSSSGCQPQISVSGSLSGDDLQFNATGIVSEKPGRLIFSTAPQSAIFLDGFQCVSAPLRFSPVLWSGSVPSGGNCSGILQYTFSSAFAAAKGISLGDTIYAQYWFRDPGASSTTGLTAAVAYSYCN